MRKSICLSLAAVAIMIISVPQGQANSMVKITPQPRSVIAKAVGESFTVTFSMEEVARLRGIQAAIKYDPNILNVLDLGVFYGDVLSGPFVFKLTPLIDDGGGIVDRIAATYLGYDRMFSGTGSLFSVRFLVVGQGACSIRLNRVIAVDDDISSIPLSTIDAEFDNSQIISEKKDLHDKIVKEQEKLIKRTDLDSYGELIGMVVDIFDNPIAGAKVSAGNGALAETLFDGSFALTLPEGKMLITYSAPGYYDSTQWLRVEQGTMKQAPTCIMNREANILQDEKTLGEIIGMVTDVSGQALKEAKIRINETEILSDTSGSFRFTLVYPGFYRVFYDAVDHIGQTQVIEVKAGATTKCPSVMMSAGSGMTSTTGIISGNVMDRDGAPIQWASARINSTIQPTTAQGEFRFTLVYPQSYDIFIDAIGYRGETIPVDAKAGQENQTQTVILKKDNQE